MAATRNPNKRYWTPSAEEKSRFLRENPGDIGRIESAFSEDIQRPQATQRSVPPTPQKPQPVAVPPTPRAASSSPSRSQQARAATQFEGIPPHPSIMAPDPVLAPAIGADLIQQPTVGPTGVPASLGALAPRPTTTPSPALAGLLAQAAPADAVPIPEEPVLGLNPNLGRRLPMTPLRALAELGRRIY